MVPTLAEPCSSLDRRLPREAGPQTPTESPSPDGWLGQRLDSFLERLLDQSGEEEANLAGFDLLVTVMAVTVTLSVLAHGITAGPLSERYGKHAEGLAEDEAALKETHEDPVPESGWRTTTAASRDATAGETS